MKKYTSKEIYMSYDRIDVSIKKQVIILNGSNQVLWFLYTNWKSPISYNNSCFSHRENEIEILHDSMQYNNNEYCSVVYKIFYCCIIIQWIQNLEVLRKYVCFL